uniref:TPR_REGION domain-containing protein n=1 Tax=Macrostomum lignano TaxID=282301 RepID=A0A1I8FM46_9PLAT
MPSANGNRRDGEGPAVGQDLQFTQEERDRINRIVSQMPSGGRRIEAPSTRLNQPIHRRDVLSNDGVEFSVPETEEDPEIELVQGLFRDRDDDEDDDDAEDDASGVSRFERKRRTMTDVFPGPRLGAARPADKRSSARAARRPRTAMVTFHLYPVRRVASRGFRLHQAAPGRQAVHEAAENSDMIPGIDWALARCARASGPCSTSTPTPFPWEQGAAPRITRGRADPGRRRVGQPSATGHSVRRVLFPGRGRAPEGAIPGTAGRCAGTCDTRQGPVRPPPARASQNQKYRAAEQVLTSMNVTQRRVPSAVRECNEGLKRDERKPQGAVVARGEALCSMGQHAEAARSLQRDARDSRRRPELEFSRDESRRPSDENDDELRKYRRNQRRSLQAHWAAPNFAGRRRQRARSLTAASSGDEQPIQPGAAAAN